MRKLTLVLVFPSPAILGVKLLAHLFKKIVQAGIDRVSATVGVRVIHGVDLQRGQSRCRERFAFTRSALGRAVRDDAMDTVFNGGITTQRGSSGWYLSRTDVDSRRGGRKKLESLLGEWSLGKLWGMMLDGARPER